MATDLAHHIQATPLVDTHEHLHSQARWDDAGPDILQELFDNYVVADLRTAGASKAAVEALLDKQNPDLAARFGGIREAWEACRFTGYGEAVQIAARVVYNLEEITPDGLAQAADQLEVLRSPEQRYRTLHDLANLDHVQIDNFCWACEPDPGGADFFLYDLSIANFVSGRIEAERLRAETQVEVRDLRSLVAAFEALFERYGPLAIAVKTQHAYGRTLRWRERSDNDAASALRQLLHGTYDQIDPEVRDCLGDWCFGKLIALAIAHRLPIKIHTGYHAGNQISHLDWIRPAHLDGLLRHFPDARFVLMHAGYPYGAELIALAKHFPNVWVDLCWAWSIDPYSTRDFVRRCLHAVPVNKLFAFGGDTRWPTAALAYSIQARRELERVLEAEVDERYLSERQAMTIASRLMHRNQADCFELDATRAAIANYQEDA